MPGVWTEDVPRSAVCYDCQRWDKKGDRFKNEAIFEYNDAMKEYMHRYKFLGDYYLRKAFQGEIKRKVRNFKGVIVPIPVNPVTYKRRGFNQVEGLLDGLKYVDAMRCVINKKIDQSAKNRSQRLKAEQTFQLRENMIEKLRDQNVLLVDDVYTTGTTIRHATEVLKVANPLQIKGLTLAR
ncbi:phosphoribosyltransferase family protein [Lentilactobacillus sp. Marseille-Q4993]|uniref:ComF family protein n=1 Tax=Lentilactobacillus sp. Marseille-Q4993 TaxID=3039492 RepID=UPI0024BCAF38|nr:phosphoribosyltransferase family protein [Lentilactobacillus sp. Marseille-Q4993]